MYFRFQYYRENNVKETDKTLSPPGAKLDLQELSFLTDKTLSPPGAKLDLQELSLPEEPNAKEDVTALFSERSSVTTPILRCFPPFEL